MRKLFTFISVGFFFQHISAQHLYSSAESNTAVDQNDVAETKVYPNPASSKLFLNTSDKMTGDVVRVYSVLGSEMMRYELAGTHNTLEVSTLQEGIYLYRIIDKNDKTILSGKFNKE